MLYRSEVFRYRMFQKVPMPLKVLVLEVGNNTEAPAVYWLRAGRSEDRIPVEARFSAPVQTGPGAHPASCTIGTGIFLGVKSGRGVTLTPHRLLVPLVMKE